MDKGRVRDVGTHHQLLEDSLLYRRLYELQFSSHEDVTSPSAASNEPALIAV